MIKPSKGKDFAETFLHVAADVKNQTGSIYYKLFKVGREVPSSPCPCCACTPVTLLKVAACCTVCR